MFGLKFRLSAMILCKMQSRMWSVLVLVLAFSVTWSSPAFPPESRPGLPVVSELSSLLASRTARLQDPRLPLPTPQDIEAIKKVAQILQMLGEQVIPAIIGESPGSGPGCDMPPPVVDVPNDAVNDN